MSFIFQGNLCGLICKDCPEPISNTEIRLYKVDPDINLVGAVAADAKETFKVLTDKEVKAKSKALLAKGKTDGQGNFNIAIDRKDYNGGPFEIDLYFEQIPNQKETDKQKDPVQVTITTLQPMWYQVSNGYIAAWEYCIPERFWCGIRALFDAWTICGQVVNCESKLPIKGLKVIACDRDLLRDDRLGEGVTDSNGKFRIDYTSADFKKTFLSPLINVETPFPPFNTGPDVYFIVESASGSMLLEEPRSKGKERGRENIGNCFCVLLCVQEKPQNPEVEPLFTHVGNFRIPAATGPGETAGFDANGLTTAGFAFTSTCPLKGTKPGGVADNPWEYRFTYENLDTGASGPVTGNIIAQTKIGEITKIGVKADGTLYEYTQDYFLNHPTLTERNVTPDANGWIKVPTENNKNTVGLFAANDFLANMDTRKLETKFFDLISPTIYEAGNNIPSSAKPVPPSPTYKITFEARVVGTSGTPKSNALEKIVISNASFKQRRHPYWAGGDVTTIPVCMLDINELKTGNGCDKILTNLTVKYSAYHPHIGKVKLWIEGNGAPPAVDITPDATGEATATYTGFNPGTLEPCAYILWLTVPLKLTNGVTNVDPFYDRIAFCVSKS